MFGTKYLSSYGTYEFQAYSLHCSFDRLCNKNNWDPTIYYVRILDNEYFFSKRYVWYVIHRELIVTTKKKII
mgnify:CR=1 FL=1